MADSRAENDTQASSLSDESQCENQDNPKSTSDGKKPEITNPRWENAGGQTITKALVGDEVFLCADVADIADGASATIRIAEKDADGNGDDVTTLSAAVEDGKIKCKWKVIYTEDDDDSNSAQEKEEKGYTLPEYAFTMECGGAESDESAQLDVLGWIKFQLKEIESDRILSKAPVKILKEDGSFIKCKSDENGYVYLKDLLRGRYSIGLDAD